jgi:hypothetical protein
VLLLTLALAFDFVIISRCSVALDLYLGLRHDVQQQQEQEQQRTQVVMVSSSTAKRSTQLGGTGGRGSA